MKSTKWRIRICSICLSFLLLSTSLFTVSAKKNVKDLEDDISALNQKLENLEDNLDDILAEIDAISDELESIKDDLAVAKGQEEAQYESMKLRIKYMYENGNYSFLESLLASGSVAEFVSRTEFYSAITEYDRKMLQDLVTTQETISEKEKELLEKQEYLIAMQEGLDKKIADASSDLSSFKSQLEKAKAEAKAAEEAAKENVKPQTPSKPSTSTPSNSKPSSGTTTTNRDPVQATASDVELLAALLECEAGSTNYEAVLAVASVVVNRMKSPYYPNTLRGVIFQSGQFPPALNGKVDRILARGVKPLCVQAAQDALNGKNNVGNCLSFRASSSGRPGIVIGDNVFF